MARKHLRSKRRTRTKGKRRTGSHLKKRSKLLKRRNSFRKKNTRKTMKRRRTMKRRGGAPSSKLRNLTAEEYAVEVAKRRAKRNALAQEERAKERQSVIDDFSGAPGAEDLHMKKVKVIKKSDLDYHGRLGSSTLEPDTRGFCVVELDPIPPEHQERKLMLQRDEIEEYPEFDDLDRCVRRINKIIEDWQMEKIEFDQKIEEMKNSLRSWWAGAARAGLKNVERLKTRLHTFKVAELLYSLNNLLEVAQNGGGGVYVLVQHTLAKSTHNKIKKVDGNTIIFNAAPQHTGQPLTAFARFKRHTKKKKMKLEELLSYRVAVERAWANTLFVSIAVFQKT